MFRTCLALSLCAVIYSCAEDNIEVPKSNLKIHINRVDQQLFTTDVPTIQELYPVFSDIYFKNIVPLQTEDGNIDETQLNAFRGDEFIVELKEKTDSLYPDLADLELELAASIDAFLQATDETATPKIYAFIGGLSYQCFVFDDNGADGIGIGLDMFLGDAFPYEQLSPQNSAFSAYITRAFNKEHVTKKVMETILDDRMGRPKGNRLLDHMIHHGKKAYLLEQFIPFAHDSIIMEYTAAELDWCEENQAQIWSHLLRENLFYETDFRKINKLINPSPDSPGMPSDAPGRTANFIGWKVVKAFMTRQPNVTVNELITWEDNQALLDQSKYKPR